MYKNKQFASISMEELQTIQGGVDLKPKKIIEKIKEILNPVPTIIRGTIIINF